MKLNKLPQNASATKATSAYAMDRTLGYCPSYTVPATSASAPMDAKLDSLAFSGFLSIY